MAKTLDAVAPDASLAALREQLEAAAAAFSADAEHLAALLRAIVGDVARAVAEPLEVFPVKHHSPASALHMLRRLQQRAPQVIFMEGCEDLGPALEGLRNCRFPVALQAFAPEAETFPVDWTPLNLVLPLTEFSAEYQAIAYCMQHPETELVFVDRSVDHVFQWQHREGPPPGVAAASDDDDDGATETTDEGETTTEGTTGNTANLHGGAVGLQIGDMQPTFSEFVAVLLRSAKVRHYSEWWSHYVEGPTLAADYATYRHVFFLVGSLIRRIGVTEADRQNDAQRERYMWTRMREHLRARKLDPSAAIYVCGALHAVSPIPEVGVASTTAWQIPARTPTRWFYGVVPSSFQAIEHQFNLPAGEIAIAQTMWEKGLKTLGLQPYRIPNTADDKAKAKPKPSVRVRKSAPSPLEATPVAAPSPVAATGGELLRQFLTRPPDFVEADDEQLLQWCVEIVRAARKHGYLASTADTIAIYHTAGALARLRDRPHPSPYDFQDAAITCLEKDRVPGRRSIVRLCQILLGGDRLGRVGYDSLPPLARDVYDRLTVLGLNLKSARVERALLDIQNNPQLLPASDLLWRLRYLGVAVRPIMGERSLGHKPRQESWDIEIGKHQSALIQLGYEGMTVEQVVEKRLKAAACRADARASTALAAAEDSLLYLKSGRLTRELGLQAIVRLRQEVGADDAPEIFTRVRRLVHYYRTVGLPEWIKDFVSTGYRHYTTLLPHAFVDRGVSPRQLAAMLAFIFTQEALAFAMGCERSQLLIALSLSEPEDPAKLALWWAAQWLVGQRDEADVRTDFEHIMTSPLLLASFPEYMAGFLLALEFSPRISRLSVELLTRAFASLPDAVLVPWLPKLVVSLRPLGPGAMQTLVKEAGLAFPRRIDALPAWEFPWQRTLPGRPPAAAEPTTVSVSSAPTAPVQPQSPGAAAMSMLLQQHRASLTALAGRLGVADDWPEAGPPAEHTPLSSPTPASTPEPAAAAGPVATLLAAHPATLTALLARLGDTM